MTFHSFQSDCPFAHSASYFLLGGKWGERGGERQKKFKQVIEFFLHWQPPQVPLLPPTLAMVLPFFPVTPEKRSKRWGGPKKFCTLGRACVGEDVKCVETFQKRASPVQKKGGEALEGWVCRALSVKLPIGVSFSPNPVWVCMSGFVPLPQIDIGHACHNCAVGE